MSATNLELIELEPAGLSLRGVSVAGLVTAIDLPRHKLCFDLGGAIDPLVARDTILFTHAHIDHMGAICWHAAMRGMRGMKPATYVVPASEAAAVGQLFQAWRRLDRSELAHQLIGLEPGQEWRKSKELVVRPFRSPHRVLCQGYTLWRQSTKLRDEYRGLPGAELSRLRKSGVELSELHEEAEIAFTGDTRIDVVDEVEVVRKARVLVMEITFLDERVDVERARSTGHVHLDEVVERADLFENQALVFTHFSQRYSRAQVLALLRKKLPSHLLERSQALI